MITNSTFRPAWWLPGAHLQTLYPTLFRRRTWPSLQRERLELADGDFIDLDWSGTGNGPIIVVLHGLEGSLQSHYSGGMLGALVRHGYRAVLMYFRGCSGEPNRLSRSYHSGETGDLAKVIGHIRQRYPAAPIAAIGYSLGGNVLLKWLGETGNGNELVTAVAVSVPFDLNRAARKLERGLSRIYQRHLLRKLRRSVSAKASRIALPVPTERLRELKTFRQFDDAITAPLHGFRDVDDYYHRASSHRFLQRISTPTLILHARNDPFLPAIAIPGEHILGPATTLELSEDGGHVGFITGPIPLRPRYWLEERICHHLAEHL
jgi:predicted alpha/beta-fold hydrolase